VYAFRMMEAEELAVTTMMKQAAALAAVERWWK
jgi:hypothetical protein